jgi:hypothetical protein
MLHIRPWIAWQALAWIIVIPLLLIGILIATVIAVVKA